MARKQIPKINGGLNGKSWKHKWRLSSEPGVFLQYEIEWASARVPPTPPCMGGGHGGLTEVERYIART